MSSYQPFLIANFREGLLLDREPWLLPPKAFARLRNAQLKRGVLKKRLGYTLWQNFPYAVKSELLVELILDGGYANSEFEQTIDGGYADSEFDQIIDALRTIWGELANKPIQPKSVSFTDGSQIITDDGNGILTGDGSGAINYDTGEYNITFNSATSGDETCDYQYHPGNPIMGIYNFYTSTGSSQLLVFDTKRMARYDPLDGRLIDICEQDIWTGDEADYIWTEIIKDKMYITNNIDRVKSWDGGTLETPVFDINGDGQNDIDCCLLIFNYKGHMVLLRTTENGTLHAQRARWSKAGLPEDFTNDGFVDAPTLDWIVGADFLGDDLIVFFERSIWALKYTHDPDLPFRWEKIVSTDGAYATFSVVSFSNELLALGATSLIGTDGLDSYSITDKIPDIVLNINANKFHYAYAVIIEENSEMLMLYPPVDEERNKETLVLNYDDNAWSIFTLEGTVFGYFEQQSDLTWDDIEATWDEIEWSWDDKEIQAGYPTTLMGGYNGEIFILNNGGDDNGKPIGFDVETGWLNPFIKEGRQARLGWVDFLVTRDPNISLTVEFYVDHLTSPYVSQTITFADGSDDEKIWIRAYAGARGGFHKIRLYHKVSNQTPEIHAMMIYFKPEGKL